MILSVLVIEDLAMAFYLPLLSALLLGAGVVAGAVSLAVAVATVLIVLVVAIRYGHLVDATECAEIAMTHLGQLKAAMNHRLRIEDEQHAGETPY